MKKWVINATGAYIVIIGIIASLLITFGVITFNSNSDTLEIRQMIVVYVLIALWLISTGLGLILVKNWSRYSLFIMSVIALFIGVFFCMAIATGFGNLDKSAIAIDSIAFMFIFTFLVVLPIAFLWYFGTPSAKEIFNPKKMSIQQRVKLPLGVIIVSAVILIFALYLLLYVFFSNYPNVIFVGHIAISGVAVNIYFLAMTLLYFYVAIGLFKLRRNALIICVLYLSTFIVLRLLNLFTVDIDYLKTLRPDVTWQEYTSERMYRIIYMTIEAVILIYLIPRRKLFNR
ncbi:MAG: hypothetical protein PHI59_00615 [Candidatus Omnitrophica bacterium]|nr:hypothetical protein [Candidatus Omnitrophota bacterium]